MGLNPLPVSCQLEQELSSIKMAPPPAPCPETPAAAPSNEMTPELKLALEKWFSDRVKVRGEGGEVKVGVRRR